MSLYLERNIESTNQHLGLYMYSDSWIFTVVYCWDLINSVCVSEKVIKREKEREMKIEIEREIERGEDRDRETKQRQSNRKTEKERER